ncbi:hypothetical protein BGZ59_008247 [Podila verticillata]|nr:hypothetical protein BGZ59_008247 [Podila verticillata]
MADCGDCGGGADCGDCGDCGGCGDCGDCGDCGNCDCCVGCGDSCCTFWGDAFCCDTTSASISVDPSSLGTPLGGADLIPAAIGSGPIDGLIPASTGVAPTDSIIRSAPGPVLMDYYPVYYGSGPQLHGGYREETIHFKPPKKRRECCGFALGVTVYLTLQIPFGTNCGNTHRGLMGVLFAIVLVGMCLPIYYHYIERDLVKKEHKRQQMLAEGGGDPEKGLLTGEQEPNFFYYYNEDAKHNKLKKKSVMASSRFLVALSAVGWILMVIVALGWYYLWSEENHCTDSRLWIVKGWFIVLLILTLGVIMWMIGAMFRKRKEREILKLAQEARAERGNLLAKDHNIPVSDQKSEAVEAKPVVTPSAPPQPSPSPTQLIEIKETLDEQQKQQHHQQQAAQVPTNMGPSGPGTYC